MIDVLRELKAAGDWDNDPDDFFNALVANARAGRIVTRTIDRNGRSLRWSNSP